MNPQPCQTLNPDTHTDWIMMSAISKLTAVVPVISKADTFTAKEMEDFKKEIMQVRVV